MELVNNIIRTNKEHSLLHVQSLTLDALSHYCLKSPLSDYIAPSSILKFAHTSPFAPRTTVAQRGDAHA